MCKQFPSCVTVHIYRLFYLLPYTILVLTKSKQGTAWRIHRPSSTAICSSRLCERIRNALCTRAFLSKSGRLWDIRCSRGQCYALDMHLFNFIWVHVFLFISSAPALYISAHAVGLSIILLFHFTWLSQFSLLRALHRRYFCIISCRHHNATYIKPLWEWECKCFPNN